MNIVKCFSILISLTIIEPSTSDISPTSCVTIPCVLSASSIAERINPKIDPCNDFYEYACGSFLEDTFTPDESSSVDTLTIMSDSLSEELVTLFLKASDGIELESHKLAKDFFRSCMAIEVINERGLQPMKNILEFIGGWPLIEGSAWNESLWDWENSILKLRKFILKRDNNIFQRKQEPKNPVATKKFDAEDDFARVESSFKVLLRNIALILGADDDQQLVADIGDLVKFEETLDENTKKLKLFRQKFVPKVKPSEKWAKIHKYLLWMEIFSPNILADPSRTFEEVPENFNVIFFEFLENTSKRTLANYIGWRVLAASLLLLDDKIRKAFLEFETAAFGKQDFEQRWKFCVVLTAEKVGVGAGSLYVSQFFSENDKSTAEEMVDYILEEYKETIKSSEWMDDNVKAAAFETANKMLKFIGYHEKLLTKEATDYYVNLEKWSTDNFLEMGLALNTFYVDREFARLHAKRAEKVADWTKYSKPATVNAFYNGNDNSIQFPAAILQRPNFDKDRSFAINFGAIGSIIGHEITHAFDNFASNSQQWSDHSKKIYDERVECLVSHYSSYRVSEIENHFKLENFHLNGNLTKKEDIADNGGVKLALNAFKKFSNTKRRLKGNPVGFEEFSAEKLFFLSFAQTFCSVERPEKMLSRVEADVHSLNRFRVIGPLSNLQEFSDVWKCPLGSPMNPQRKCIVW